MFNMRKVARQTLKFAVATLPRPKCVELHNILYLDFSPLNDPQAAVRILFKCKQQISAVSRQEHR